MSRTEWQEKLLELTLKVSNLSEEVRALRVDRDIDREATATCACGRWRCRQSWTIAGTQPWWYERDSGGRNAQRAVFCYDCNTFCRADGTIVTMPSEEDSDEHSD